MTSRHILARFERLRAAYRSGRSQRSVNHQTLFLTLVVACDLQRGLTARRLAEVIGITPRHASNILAWCAMRDLLACDRKHAPGRGGHGALLYSATEVTHHLIGLEPLTPTISKP